MTAKHLRRSIAIRQLRQTPIFDTNVFGDVQRGLISQTDWKRLLRYRPCRGWPLSALTALELLVAVDAAGPQNFLQVRELIERSYDLSKGRILEVPRFLICKEVLHIPFPSDTPRLPPRLLSKYMDVIRRAGSLDQLVNTGVPYKRGRATVNGTSVFTEVVADPKNDWIAAVERMADETYPAWREEEKRTGKRLPPEKRRELKQQSYWQLQRGSLTEGLLNWLGASTDAATIKDMSQRIDAVLEFTIFVARSFLLSDYSAGSHDSDIFDMFQLQYLAMDRFVIVTGDKRIANRTQRSSQAARIMSFDQFLQSLRTHATS